MKKYSIIFFWGMLISFLGSLPPGTMNIAATHIAMGQGDEAAAIYAAGSMLAEVIIVRLALSGIKQILLRQKLFCILEFFTAGLLLTITTACFMAAANNVDINNFFSGYHLPPFKTGVLLSATNPLHIPFWLGWTSVLLNKQLISPVPKQYNVYILGIGTGTLLGFAAFIYTGDYLLNEFCNHQRIIWIVVGITLLAVSFFHIKRMIMLPVSVRYDRIKINLPV
jgi:threonine/homoserine/homoserine lactone efflux protein